MMRVANSALMAQQAAMQTIAQNIANAQTPGYSRQEVVSDNSTSLQSGNGSGDTEVRRVRDQLLDDSYRTTAGQAGEADARRSLLSQIESIYGGPNDRGIPDALDEFWGAWSDLSASPESGAGKVIVQQRGDSLARLLNAHDARLTQVRDTGIKEIEGVIIEINQQAKTIADLNRQISASETTGSSSNELLDQRDRALDKLAKNGGIRVFKNDTGILTVMLGASTIVEGGTARLLSGTSKPVNNEVDAPYQLFLTDSPVKISSIGGRLGGLLTVINNTMPDVRGQLDAMASSLVTKVNAVHSQGFLFANGALPGTGAGNFFDAGVVGTPVTASTIRLDATVKASASNIAVSGDAGAPSNNGVAVQMRALMNDQNAISFTNRDGGILAGSFLGFHRDAMTTLGYSVRAAEDDATATATSSSQAEARRQSVIGVNTDEELVRLMRFQQSYSAAAKLIKSLEEMSQTLLTMF
jgi:flagellar hook-associated protein 1 FlgK